MKLHCSTMDTQAAITGPPAYDAATCVDTLVITSGSSRVYPNLCGTLTGQHSKIIFLLNINPNFGKKLEL